MLGAGILAGGKGNRIGGLKEFISLGGRPLLLHVVERTLRAADEVVVVVRKGADPSEYRKVLPPSVKVVNDVLDSEAPMIGMMTAFMNLRSELALLLPCDAPFLNPDVLKFLHRSAESHDAAIPKWPNALIEPLHAVYRVRAALDASRKAVKAGEYKNLAMINRLSRVNYVSTESLRVYDPELLSFFNINTQEDLAMAEKSLLGRH